MPFSISESEALYLFYDAIRTMDGRKTLQIILGFPLPHQFGSALGASFEMPLDLGLLGPRKITV